MDKKKLIKIIAIVVLIPVIVLGVFWLIKNRSTVSNVIQNITTTGGGVQTSERSKLSAQLSEKESQYKKITDQIASVQSTCSNVDLEKVGKKEIQEVNRENFTQTVGGYYACEAVKNKDMGRCDFLKDVSQKLFESCVFTTVGLSIASEKCSTQSISQCTQSGLSQSDCNSMCNVYVKGDASSCSAVKDSNLNKGCSALAQKNVSLCNGITDDFQRKSCIDEYYLYSAIKNNNADLLNKMESGFKQSFGKVVFDNNVSCKEEFSKFIQESDCASGLISDYEDLQRQADILKQEIEGLNKKLQEL